MPSHLLMCYVLISGYPAKQYPVGSENLTTCVAVADAAASAGIDPEILTAVAYVESRFISKAVSRAGAIGPLQIIPKYFCPGKRARGCDLIAAGVTAFLRWRSLHPKLKDTLCHYNSGNRCNRYSRRYSRIVIAHITRVKKSLSRVPWFRSYTLDHCYRCPSCCTSGFKGHQSFLNWMGEILHEHN